MVRESKPFLLLLVCVMVLSGCAVSFFYNQLDWLVPWYLEDYIELDSTQDNLFKARLDAYLDWHRHDQLPQYAVFLDQVAERAEQGMTRQDIATIQTRTGQLAQAMVDKLKPDMLDLFAMASDKQIRNLFEKFTQDNEEYRKEYIDLSIEKQRRQRAKEVIHYAERWTGSLNKKQKQLIDDWSIRFEPLSADLAETRLAWQQEFHRILLQRANREVYDTAFLRLMDNPGFGQTPAFEQKLQHNQAILIDLYLALEHSLTDKQRKHMVQKLQSYAEDFRDLALQK